MCIWITLLTHVLRNTPIPYLTVPLETQVLDPLPPSSLNFSLHACPCRQLRHVRAYCRHVQVYVNVYVHVGAGSSLLFNLNATGILVREDIPIITSY